MNYRTKAPNIRLDIIGALCVLVAVMGCDPQTISQKNKPSRPSDESEGIPNLLTEETVAYIPGSESRARIRNAELIIPAGATNTSAQVRIRRVNRADLSAEHQAVLASGEMEVFEVEMVSDATGNRIAVSDLAEPFTYRQTIASPSDPTMIKLTYSAPIQPEPDTPNRSKSIAGNGISVKSGGLSLISEDVVTVSAEIMETNFYVAAHASPATITGIDTSDLVPGTTISIDGKFLHDGIVASLGDLELSVVIRSSNRFEFVVPELDAGSTQLKIREASDEIFTKSVSMMSSSTTSGSSGAGSTGAGGTGGTTGTGSGTTGTGSGGGTGSEGDGSPGFHRIFATSQVYNGNLGGMAGAHQKCMSLAKNRFHNQSGDDYYKTYRAILSVSGLSAKQHIIAPSTMSVKNTGISLGPEIFTSTVSDLFSGDGGGAEFFTENGAAVPSGTQAGRVWTGSSATGAASMDHCSNWTDGTGISIGAQGDHSQYFGSGGFLSAGSSDCSTTAPIYCISGMPHFAFVTSTTYNGNLGGLSGADEKCQARADAGAITSKLGLKWKALISTSTTAARSNQRINIQAPVYTLDTSSHASLIANNATDFWDGSLGVLIDKDEDGVAAETNVIFWSGTTSAGARNTEHNAYCNDWTAGIGTSGLAGESQNAQNWNLPQMQLCQMASKLLCVSIADDIN